MISNSLLFYPQIDPVVPDNGEISVYSETFSTDTQYKPMGIPVNQLPNKALKCFTKLVFQEVPCGNTV